MNQRVFLDNHSTTPVDPAVIDAMMPYQTVYFGNPGSTHAFGGEARAAVETARATIAKSINAHPDEIVFTSGATESNNLAIRGVAERHADRGNHVVTVATEHPSVLEPAQQHPALQTTIVPVQQVGSTNVGVVEVEQFWSSIRDNTILASVMLANHEIGVIQPVADLAKACRERGVLFHCDATQAVGKTEVDVRQLDIDLMSFSAHKVYGPRGVGALYIRRRPRVRLTPQILGGGQQRGRRSGTINTPGVVGFAKALELCNANFSDEQSRIRELRDRLWEGLASSIPDVELNGPSLDHSNPRLAGNLNILIYGIDSESLMIQIPQIAVSTGSACSAENHEPSHVLLATGRSEDEARSSLRFGVGRFNTMQEIEIAVSQISQAVTKLRRLA